MAEKPLEGNPNFIPNTSESITPNLGVSSPEIPNSTPEVTADNSQVATKASESIVDNTIAADQEAAAREATELANHMPIGEAAPTVSGGDTLANSVFESEFFEKNIKSR